MTIRPLIPIAMYASFMLAAPLALGATRDRDHDKLPDRWEHRYHLSTAHNSAKADSDHDGLSNLREYRLKLNPRRADTDRDGLKDGVEVKRYHTNPRKRDTDGDGLSDGAEVKRYHTDPRKRDTDGDGISDGAEIKAGTNPLKADAPSALTGSGAAPVNAAAPSPAGNPSDPGLASVGPPTGACSVTATPSTLGSQLTATAAGQTLCLGPGDYGSFKGASKSGAVVLAGAPGGASSMSLNLTNAANVVLDGMTIRGGSVTGSTHGIVVRNSAFTESTTFDGLANAAIVFDHDTFNNIQGGGQYDSPARLHLSYSSGTPSGVTIQNSVLNGGSADGVQSGVGVNIINNEFTNIREGSCGDCHTDAIQLIDASGSVVRGNWVHNNQDGITAFDGLENATITDNAVGPQQSDPDCIDMYALQNSTIAHNSCTSGMDIWLDHKDGDPASSGNTIRDNFAPKGLAGRDVSSNVRTGNLTNPSYAGGSAPTSYAGFRLTPSSAGLKAASDGLDVGIRF